MERMDGIWGARHVGALGNEHASLDNESLCGPLVKLILRCAWHRNVDPRTGNVPGPHPLEEFSRRGEFRVLGQAHAVDVLQLHDLFQHVGRDAFGLVYGPLAVGHGHRHSSQLDELLDSILSYVACTTDRNPLPFYGTVVLGQHLLCEVHNTIASSFRPDVGSSPCNTLTGQSPCEFIFQPLVLSKKIAYFSCTDSNVPSRHICVWSYMTAELCMND
mmetsp:Transcript_28702/g.68484  ORF Transcript_28702/g.68484 Transcript_28702/m.68484 type:complete len:217 (-) Transcript_28702:993-1643(-)